MSIPFNQYSIVLTEELKHHDTKSLMKCCETLAFLVRDAAHVTPHNFDSCVHAIRMFVEASIDAGNLPVGYYSPLGRLFALEYVIQRSPVGRPLVFQCLIRRSLLDVINSTTFDNVLAILFVNLLLGNNLIYDFTAVTFSVNLVILGEKFNFL